MSSKRSEYLPLTTEDAPHSQEGYDYPRQHKATQKWRYGDRLPCLLVIFLQSLLTIALTIALWQKGQKQSITSTSSGPNWPARMWSPAQDVLEYEVKVFTGGFDNATTIYQEVSDAADEAWERLYSRTLMRIPKSDAALLPNKTYPIKEFPGYYVTELDVFHQLHCLNKIRQALNKERYWSTLKHPEDHLGEDHISHCVDSIRQSLMCNADISTIPWQWHELSKSVRIRLNYPHKCVNFEKLWDWVDERHLDDYIDSNVFVDDGLDEPEVIY